MTTKQDLQTVVGGPGSQYFPNPKINGLNGLTEIHYLEAIPRNEAFEKEYPQLGKEFRKIQNEQYELFMNKMLSYGPNNITLGTELNTPEEKKLSLTGIWIRSMDKMQRLKQLVLLSKPNPLDNEPADDAYIDLSNYSIIALLVSKGLWKK